MDQGKFRLPQTPELATDAELSGMFRVLEDMRSERDLIDDDNAAERTALERQLESDSSERSSAARGACAAAGIHNRGALLVPGRSDENGGDGDAPGQSPFRLSDHAQRARRAMLDAGFDL